MPSTTADLVLIYYLYYITMPLVLESPFCLVVHFLHLEPCDGRVRPGFVHSCNQAAWPRDNLVKLSRFCPLGAKIVPILSRIHSTIDNSHFQKHPAVTPTAADGRPHFPPDQLDQPDQPVSFWGRAFSTTSTFSTRERRTLESLREDRIE